MNSFEFEQNSANTLVTSKEGLELVVMKNGPKLGNGK